MSQGIAGVSAIKITDPCLDGVELSAVQEVLASGQLVQAERVRQFEKLFAESVGVSHAVMASSGTAALHLTLLACGIGPGDAVAVPDYTFVATANAVALTGATPLLVDVDIATCNIDVAALRRVVERFAATGAKPRLRMIMPVHQFGLPAEIDAIATLANEYELLLVEDAACAIGSRYHDRHVGTRGQASCFSFHPRKVLTTGEGGAVVTNDGALAERVRALRAHGLSVAGDKPTLVTWGFNYRMTEIHAAIGLAQMSKLESMLLRRRQLADRLQEELSGLTWFTRPVVPAHVTPNWQSYVGVLSPDVSRSQTIERLAASGIEARPPATAIHTMGPYREAARATGGTFPVAEMLDRCALALPLHPRMDEGDVTRVVTELRHAGRA
jgi:perosamine synthetase